MKRRVLFHLVPAVSLWPLVGHAQPRKARVGFLGSLPNNPMMIAAYSAFSGEMRKLGWIEGGNLAIEYRYNNRPGVDLAAEVAEFVRSKVDVIVVGGPETALQAALNVTRTIPIAMIAVNFDPISRGYVSSLARPGGSVTGLFLRQPELSAKQLEFMTQTLPGRTRVAALYDELSADQFAASQQAAARMTLSLRGLKLENPPYDFGQAFLTLSQRSPDMLLVLSSPHFTASQAEIAALAIEHRLPAMFIFKSYVEAGGLMSYGVDYIAMQARIAHFVAKILRGAKPADIPIEQPTEFELVINAKTARALGLEIPLSVLSRADQVIE